MSETGGKMARIMSITKKKNRTKIAHTSCLLGVNVVRNAFNSKYVFFVKK